MGPSIGVVRCGKSRPPPGFDPRTFQPAATFYIDCAFRAPFNIIIIIIIIIIIRLLCIVLLLTRLTLNLLTTTIAAPPSNASKWQMGFNSAFKGLSVLVLWATVGLSAQQKNVVSF